MESSKLSVGFKNFLDSLNSGTKTKEWIYLGKTDDAFGSPGGSWKGFDGYKFESKQNNEKYLIRSIPKHNYIVLESYQFGGQLFNMDLSSEKIHSNKDNQSVLFESYRMTAGKGRVKKKDVKDAFNSLGVNSNIISTITNVNPNWEELTTSLIKWSSLREQVKKHLKSNIDNEHNLKHVIKENGYNAEAEQKFPLNQILFGPPGTGKTYHSINKAIAIIDNIKEESLSYKYESRNDLKNKFDELLIDDWENGDGQLSFVTFHQSMSYEEFIEGIKPDVNGDKKDVTYDIEPGLFRSIVSLAKENWLEATKGSSKILSFEDAFEQFKEEWENNPEMTFPLRSRGYDYTILGFNKYSIFFKKSSGGTGHTLSIGTLRDLYYGKRELKLKGVGIYYPAILDKLKSYEPVKKEKKELENYVLIIDEINRGNVSQIFGELITLIEEDKRLGKDEAIEVTLPYSKEKFGVPPNLYIIGTMNTADRSVEALDTALRRRFDFTEMPPIPELVSPRAMIHRLWCKDEINDKEFERLSKNLYELLGIDPSFENQFNDDEDDWDLGILDDAQFQGIHLDKLLSTINNRIEILLNRDHLIGHSYFFNIYSWDDLMESFYRNIIPLLQEYFYGDYAKIGMVLGGGFVHNQSDNNEVQFASGYQSEDFTDKTIFQIIDYRADKPGNKFIQNDMDFEKAINLLMNKDLQEANEE